MLRFWAARLRKEERGFTLPELVTTIVILGILVAIGVIIFLAILERWRVETATDQLVSDLRLAHSSATNQLTDWRVVLNPEEAGEDEGNDYHMVKLKAPYPGPTLEAGKITPRTFPANVKIVNIAGALDTDSGWVIAPSRANETRTLEFDADGAMNVYQAVSGSTCVTVDGNPQNRVKVLAATSRVKVEPGEC